MKLTDVLDQAFTKQTLVDATRESGISISGKKEDILKRISQSYSNDSNVLLSLMNRDFLVAILEHFKLDTSGSNDDLVRRIRSSLLHERVFEWQCVDEYLSKVWPLVDERLRVHIEKSIKSMDYKNAVLDSFIIVENRVKKYYRQKTNKESTGVDLMNKAFGFSGETASCPRTLPVIEIDNLSNETGRDRQEGYRRIFSGAMMAIRNPKAHELINLPPKRAVQHLLLATLLMEILDEAGLPNLDL